MVNKCLVVISVVILTIVIAGFLGDKIEESVHLNQSPCHQVTVTNKFTILGFGLEGEYTDFYIVDNNESPYYMDIGRDIRLIAKWSSIEQNKSYPLKTYHNTAEFCEGGTE